MTNKETERRLNDWWFAHFSDQRTRLEIEQERVVVLKERCAKMERLLSELAAYAEPDRNSAYRHCQEY